MTSSALCGEPAVMQLPNTITLGRLVIAVASFVALELAGVNAVDAALVWLAFGLFILAAATDFLDGYLARLWHQVTPLGRVLDPLADKVLTCGAMILLLKFPAASAVQPDWLVVVVVAREFLVTAVRGAAEASGHPFPADRLGKAKMIVQCVSCAGLMTLVAGTRFWYGVTLVATWLAFALAVVSGINYCWKARMLLGTRPV